MSTRQLERLFRRYLSRSPKRYYMELRLAKARNLLMQTDMSVINVALACGFTSPSHFSKCYRGALPDHPLPRARRLRGGALGWTRRPPPPIEAARPAGGPMSDAVVIVAAARTPIGGFQGALAPASAAELGGAAIAAALARAGLEPDAVDELSMGCVLPAGQGQAPARQAGFAAGLPESGAGDHAEQDVRLGHEGGDARRTTRSRPAAATCIVAGGMESMSNAPYLLPKLRAGARLGHAEAKDHMFLDGLEDAYDKGRLMGSFAEDCATEFQFTRAGQDAYALASLTRARDARATAPSPPRSPR